MREGLEGCEGWQAFVEMRIRRFQLQVITCTTVISASSKGWMAVWALQVFEEMVLQGFHPNVVTYTAVISASGTCQLAVRTSQLVVDLLWQGPPAG